VWQFDEKSGKASNQGRETQQPTKEERYLKRGGRPRVKIRRGRVVLGRGSGRRREKNMAVQVTALLLNYEEEGKEK